MRRRLVQVLAVSATLLVLAAGCGGDSGNGSGDGARPRLVGVVYDIGGLGDGGFNDLAFAALGRAEDDLGLTVEAIEPDPSGSDRADLVRSLAGGAPGLVIALGDGALQAVDEVAGEYPEVSFVVVDDGVSAVANVTSVTFTAEQGAYLAGAAAALASTTGKIGFVGGRDDETSRRYQAGYTAGARAVDPSMRVEVGYLPPVPDNPQPDAALVKALALAHLGAGADVVFGAPREVGPALLAAALERGGGAWAIGVDVDARETADPALRGVALTSMVKQIDVVMADVLRRFAEGRLPAGALRYGVARGGVDLSPEAGTLSPEALAVLGDLRDQIIGGQIQVPTTP